MINQNTAELILERLEDGSLDPHGDLDATERSTLVQFCRDLISAGEGLTPVPYMTGSSAADLKTFLREVNAWLDANRDAANVRALRKRGIELHGKLERVYVQSRQFPGDAELDDLWRQVSAKVLKTMFGIEKPQI